MADTRKLDFEPDFTKDPKEIESLIRQKLAEARAESDTKITEKAKAKENTPGITDELKKERAAERGAVDPLAIQNVDDLKKVMSNLMDDYNNVVTRANEYEELTGSFSPVVMPITTPGYEIAGRSGVNLWKDCETLFGTKEQPPYITKDRLDCILKVLKNGSSDFKADILDDQKTDMAFLMLETKYFEQDLGKYLRILFKLFFKGIIWNLLAMLCKRFRQLKLDIGPFTVCLGCPFADLFKVLVIFLLNGGQDWVYKIDHTTGYLIPDGAGDYEKITFGDCPPDFDPWWLQPIEELKRAARGDEEGTGPVKSICDYPDNYKPTPEEVEAAHNIAMYIMKASTNPQQANDIDIQKAASYLRGKTLNDQNKQQASNCFELANKSLGQLFEIKTTPDGFFIKEDRGKIPTTNTIMAGLNSVTVDDVGEFTKGLLKFVEGMLKVWDGIISALAVNETSILNRDLICCFLNMLMVMIGAIDGTNYDDGVEGFKKFQRNSTKFLLKIKLILDLLGVLIEFGYDDLQVKLAAEYFTLADLGNDIQDTLVKTAMTVLGPVVDGILGELMHFFTKEHLMKDLDPRKKANNNFMRALDECGIMKWMTWVIRTQIKGLRKLIFDGLTSLRSKEANKLRKWKDVIVIDRRSKLFAALKSIIDALKLIFDPDKGGKGFGKLMEVCYQNGQFNPFRADNLDKRIPVNWALDGKETALLHETYPNLFKKVAIDPNRDVGVEANDPLNNAFWGVDAAGNVVQDQGAALMDTLTYASMPMYRDYLPPSVTKGTAVDPNIVSKDGKIEIKRSEAKKEGEALDRESLCNETNFINSVLQELQTLAKERANTILNV